MLFFHQFSLILWWQSATFACSTIAEAKKAGWGLCWFATLSLPCHVCSVCCEHSASPGKLGAVQTMLLGFTTTLRCMFEMWGASVLLSLRFPPWWVACWKLECTYYMKPVLPCLLEKPVTRSSGWQACREHSFILPQCGSWRLHVLAAIHSLTFLELSLALQL